MNNWIDHIWAFPGVSIHAAYVHWNTPRELSLVAKWRDFLCKWMEVELKIVTSTSELRTCDCCYCCLDPAPSLFPGDPGWKAGRGTVVQQDAYRLFGAASKDVLLKGIFGDHCSYSPGALCFCSSKQKHSLRVSAHLLVDWHVKIWNS